MQATSKFFYAKMLFKRSVIYYKPSSYTFTPCLWYRANTWLAKSVYTTIRYCPSLVTTINNDIKKTRKESPSFKTTPLLPQVSLHNICTKAKNRIMWKKIEIRWLNWPIPDGQHGI